MSQHRVRGPDMLLPLWDEILFSRSPCHSHPRWNFQRPESMRRRSTSYSTRLHESLTTPCWKLQAVAIARLPPVKMRRPLNYGTVSVASMSNAIALTMTAS